MSTELVMDRKPFDALRREDEFGEWWSARDLMPLYGYGTWQRFKQTIERAKLACATSAHDVTSNFSDVAKIDNYRHKREDLRLTRYAAYLIAMEGDPSKPEIAAAKTYFAVQTRKAEVGVDGFDDQLQPIYQTLVQLQDVRNRQRRTEIQQSIHTQQIEENAKAVEAARTKAEAAWEEIDARKRELISLTERVDDVERITPLKDHTGLHSVKETAQFMGFGLVRFYQVLRDMGVVYRDGNNGHKIYQKYMDQGWGQAKWQEWPNGKGHSWVPFFTGLGVIKIQEKVDKMHSLAVSGQMSLESTHDHC